MERLELGQELLAEAFFQDALAAYGMDPSRQADVERISSAKEALLVESHGDQVPTLGFAVGLSYQHFWQLEATLAPFIISGFHLPDHLTWILDCTVYDYYVLANTARSLVRLLGVRAGIMSSAQSHVKY